MGSLNESTLFQKDDTRPSWSDGARRVERYSERTVRSAVEAGRTGAAKGGAFHLYGAEVFGFLAAVVGGETDALSVYEQMGSHVAARLPHFMWQCALRTWMYAIARRELAARRTEASGETAIPRLSPFALLGSLQLPASGDSVALVTGLRRALRPDDHELLILRVDRQLSYRDLAHTSLRDGAIEQDIVCEADRLRTHLKRLRRALSQAVITRPLSSP